MGLDYDLEVMEFPPRSRHADYTEINPIGTVPFFTDSGDKVDSKNAAKMTESVAICRYLVDKYGPTDLAVDVDEVDYADYLNWLYRSDATLTFPQTIILRYTHLEPKERRLEQAVDDYTVWFFLVYAALSQPLRVKSTSVQDALLWLILWWAMRWPLRKIWVLERVLRPIPTTIMSALKHVLPLKKRHQFNSAKLLDWLLVQVGIF